MIEIGSLSIRAKLIFNLFEQTIFDVADFKYETDDQTVRSPSGSTVPTTGGTPATDCLTTSYKLLIYFHTSIQQRLKIIFWKHIYILDFDRY
ncbi:MAG: hypothetical protein ACRC1Z_26165 [Waterburya sp.]